MSEVAYVALGGNLGDRGAFLAAARAAITLIRGVRLIATTPVEETIPLGAARQGPYFNQMVAMATTLAPHALLARLQGIELQLGRARGARWGSRTIDLDIVQFGARCISSAILTVPHPGLVERDFWQRELAALQRVINAAA